MSENNLSSANPEPEAAPGEFDFAAPVTERPRVRRRALTQATTPKPAQETPAPAPEKAATVVTRESTKPAATTRPASSTSPTASTTSSTQPKTAASQPTSPHGTRPATLYYSSGSRQDKETPSPMKTTSSTSPSASTTSAPATAASRPTTTAATTRPASVVDYRTNVERQSREQKSVGGLLSILVYTLIGLFVVGASLAGYGAYVITKQLDQQSVTMKDFDARYAADYKDINGRLLTTMDNLTSAQAQIDRQQALIVKQQETISKLLSAADDTAAALKMERATRAQETANLRAKIKDLEYTGPSTRKY